MFRFDRFEELRASRGVTKKFITDAIGRTSQTVQDWKNGKSEPNDSQIGIVAQILGTSVEYLRGETDESIKKEPVPMKEDEFTARYLRLSPEHRAALDNYALYLLSLEDKK